MGSRCKLKKDKIYKIKLKKCTIKIHETFKKIKKIQEDLKKGNKKNI